MAYDGSGVFTVLYNWATEAASPPIAISKLDTEMAGIATGLSTCFLRTGGTVTGASTFTNTLSLTGAVTATSTLTMSSTIPRIIWTETDAATDEKSWEWRASGGDLYLYTDTDAGSASGTPVAIARTGTTVDTITFSGTTIALAGNATVSGSLTVGGNTAATITSGNFTMEFATASSGGTVLASGTAYWKKVGGVVTMRCPYLHATTADYTLYLRGIPAACQPSLTGTYTQSIAVPASVNGVVGLAEIRVAEGVAYWVVEGLSAAWSSGSADKGIGNTTACGPTITYQVTD